MKKIFVFLNVMICFSATNHLRAQSGESVEIKQHVNEFYFKEPLLNVLHDFETKYGLKIKYDSAQVAGYRCRQDFQSVRVTEAFKQLFDDLKGLSYYMDGDGCYCVVPTGNMPRNRTGIENKRYTGEAGRRNLTVTGRIKDQTNGEFLPFATIQVEGFPTIATTTNTDGYFTLYNVPSDTVALIFRYLGYETQYFYL